MCVCVCNIQKIMVIRKMYFNNNEIFHFPSKVLNKNIINSHKLNMNYNNINNYNNNNNNKKLNIYSKWHYIIGIITLLCNLSNGKILPDENGPLSEVQTAVGLEVSMPCDLMPATVMPDATDKVQLVIWYKEGNIKPIYSFDARGKPLQQASHWADEDVLKQKAKFYYDSNPPSLRIKNVQRDDAGLYRCRVDFQRSPTRNWRINMTVLVPPTKLSVLDANGAAILDNIVGPYNLGTSINLTCLSSGGIPPPRVSWWREHALLDDTYQILPDGTVRNVLQLINISRDDLMRVYTCQATNGHVVAPLSSAVKLDMNLPPLYIRLQGLNHPLVAGVRTQITCSSAGARPPPQIVWNKGGTMMRGSTQTTSSDGNLTISELVFIPVPEDNEKHVICSVTGDSSSSKMDSIIYNGIGSTVSSNSIGNNGIFLKDSRVLDVKHAPIVSLNLGAPLDPNNLMKGSDVYLECDIKANPSAKKVEWYHNDEQLHSTRGIIISNQTLVLQGISKITHGQYFCRASNIQGTVSSNEVYLDVKYPPVCKSDSTVIRAALKQIVNITCQVDSNPLQNLTYKWSFNNSLETIVDLPQILRHSNRILSSSDNINDHLTSELNEKLIDENSNDNWSPRRHLSDSNIIAEPYSQMVYSNLAYQQHIDGTKVIRKTHQQQQIQQSQQQYDRIKYHSEFDKRKKHYSSHNHGHHNQQQIPPNNIYRYRVDSFEHFGTVSCVATNFIGQSQPCLYHITPAELPDPIKNCTAFNATANSIQIFCIPGNDGGIHQDFHVEVYDELNQQVLYNISYPYSEFTIKRLPSDSVFVIRVTSYNLQGFSKRAFRLRAKTLSAPLLRTASSTAVLVQLTPLLGALVGVVATLILVALCIVIFIKFRTKNRHPHHRRRSPNETTTTQTTEPDKGSAEPLSRNMGSHSSLEDKNPDIIPQENSEDEYNLEEKAFDRLNLESQRILYTPPRLHSTIISSASSPPPILSSTQPPLVSSPSFTKQYGELSLTTNPSYALYNSPQRIPAVQRPVYTEPPTLLSTKSPSNIYTRIPARSYLPSYETRASPTSPYGSTTTTCTIPLLGSTSKQNTLALSPSSMNPSLNGYGKTCGNINSNINSGKLSPSQSSIQTSLLLNNGSSVLGNYDNDS